MRPAPFEYTDAHSVEEACALLARHGPEAAVLAGGQSLVAALTARRLRPRVVVGIGRIAELSSVSAGADGALSVGATVTQRALERHPAAPAVVVEALRCVGHVPTRNRGTVGGSVAFGDPEGELPTALLALGARVRLASVRGERTVALADLHLEPDELLTEVEVPAAIGTWAFEQRDFHRHARTSAAVGSIDGRLTVALGGVADRPVALEHVEEGLLDAVRAAVVDRADPHVPPGYRARLAVAAARAALRRVTPSEVAA